MRWFQCYIDIVQQEHKRELQKKHCKTITVGGYSGYMKLRDKRFKEKEQQTQR